MCHKIIELLSANSDSGCQRVVLLSQDSFYKNLTTEQQEQADQGLFNFDHPGTCVCVCTFILRCVGMHQLPEPAGTAYKQYLDILRLLRNAATSSSVVDDYQTVAVAKN